LLIDSVRRQRALSPAAAPPPHKSPPAHHARTGAGEVSFFSKHVGLLKGSNLNPRSLGFPMSSLPWGQDRSKASPARREVDRESHAFMGTGLAYRPRPGTAGPGQPGLAGPPHPTPGGRSQPALSLPLLEQQQAEFGLIIHQLRESHAHAWQVQPGLAASGSAITGELLQKNHHPVDTRSSFWTPTSL